MQDDLTIARPSRTTLARAWRDMRATATQQTLIPGLVIAVLVALAGWGLKGTLDATALIAAAIGVGAWLVIVYAWHVVLAPIRLSNERAKLWEDERGARTAELGTATRRLALMDASPRPNLSFSAPRSVDGVLMVGGGMQSWAFGGVVNRHSSPGKGLTAQRAHLTLTYTDENDEELAGPFPGKWRDATSPLQQSPLQLHNDSYALELHANESVYEFDLATRHINNGQIIGVDAGQNLHLFQEQTVRIEVVLKGVNFETLTARYAVTTTDDGLTVEALENT